MTGSEPDVITFNYTLMIFGSSEFNFDETNTYPDTLPPIIIVCTPSVIDACPYRPVERSPTFDHCPCLYWAMMFGLRNPPIIYDVDEVEVVE